MQGTMLKSSASAHGIRRAAPSPRTRRTQAFKACTATKEVHCRSETAPVTSRRPLLLGAAAVLTGVSWPQLTGAAQAIETVDAPALGAPPPSTSTRFEDQVDQFGLEIPAGWVQAEGAIPNEGGFTGTAAGGRRTVAFFPPDRAPGEVNVSVTITNVSFEFTKLGSFGSVATFAGNLVNSLDRSYLLRAPAWVKKPTEPVQVAQLVDYKEVNGNYVIEYTVQKLPEPQRHLLSKLALGSNGRYNRLYTLTAQCREEDLPEYRAVFETALNTFKANVKPLV